MSHPKDEAIMVKGALSSRSTGHGIGVFVFGLNSVIENNSLRD